MDALQGMQWTEGESTELPAQKQQRAVEIPRIQIERINQDEEQPQQSVAIENAPKHQKDNQQRKRVNAKVLMGDGLARLMACCSQGSRTVPRGMAQSAQLRNNQQSDSGIVESLTGMDSLVGTGKGYSAMAAAREAAMRWKQTEENTAALQAFSSSESSSVLTQKVMQEAQARKQLHHEQRHALKRKVSASRMPRSELSSCADWTIGEHL